MNAFGDDTILPSLFGAAVLFLGALVITAAACWEYRSGKSNFIMRWLWRQ